MMHISRRAIAWRRCRERTCIRIATFASAAAPRPQTAPKLPARGNVVIRNAYVMTMETDVGDLKDADVHVRDGAIVAVGQKLNAPGASAIDGRGMIVMPGLVETHWHMWNTLLRGMSGEKPDIGYFRTSAGLGRVFEPGDMYQGTRLAAAEAINSGITFVHDWCHNIRGPEFARQDLRALKESGLRARFSYGPMQGHDLKQPVDLADHREAEERMGAAFQRWPDHARHGVARPRRQPARQCGAGKRLARRVRCRAAARPADLGAFERLEGSARPDRRAEQGRHDQERADDPRGLRDAGGDRRHEGGRLLDQPRADLRAAHRLRHAADHGVPRCRHSGRAVGRYRRRSSAMPTCSPS